MERPFATVSGTTTSYVDTNVASGQTWVYAVTALAMQAENPLHAISNEVTGAIR